jgi:hypothetical protein
MDYAVGTQNPTVVDLIVSNLGSNTTAEDLRRISGSRHVFDAAVDEDNLRGSCVGTGRLQIRLNHGESVEQVKLNFLREGITIQENVKDARKRPNVTQVPRCKSKEMKYHRLEKQSFLQTQHPETFGTTQHFVAMGH